MYKLLATDLDGTLLNSESELPGCNVEYIKKACEAGTHFVICSGRSVHPLEHFNKLIGIYGECYTIALNGALIFKSATREFIRDIRMERELAIEAAKEMKDFRVAVVMYVADRLVTTETAEVIAPYIKASMSPIDFISNYTELGSNVSKVLAMGETEELLRLERHIKTLSGRDFNMFMTGRHLLEITSTQADKGIGLKFLADRLEIGIDKVIACGDYYNDIDMIKTAGLGVAVANAIQEVKDVADYVTAADNNNGAIKEVIEKFIL